MKIIINYDLIDKVREANTGFSLRKFTTLVGLTNGLVIPPMIIGSELGNVPLTDTLESILRILCISSLQSFGYSYFGKYSAIENLRELSKKLKDIYVETDSELLKESYQYDIEYSINFDSFPPKLEEKKYIMVPVYNEWGSNERSLVQEHVVGSRTFALSYGEPEKNKIYSYGRRRAY